MVVGGGHVWLWGCVCGCGGVCMVAGGPAWLQGSMHGCGGVCMVAGDMHGCIGHALLQGAYVVAGGMLGCRGVHGCQGRGCAWLLGGMCGCQGVCVVAWGACIGYDEIRSMSGRYASYWNAFLFT